jgi:preprotein translocase subunit SecE
MATKNPFEFIQEVREEGNKVTWPTRRETMVTSMMVLAMIALASVFFMIVDTILNWGVNWALFKLPGL